MITRTIEYEGIVIKLRRETRQGSLLRAAYRRIFGDLHPALHTVLYAGGDDALMRDALEGLNEEELTLFGYIMDFILTMVHVVEARGLPFDWPEPGEIPTKDKARDIFAHFMLDGSGLWNAVITEANAMNEPLTPPEQQPAPVFEAKEKAGEILPNAFAPVANGSTSSSES